MTRKLIEWIYSKRCTYVVALGTIFGTNKLSTLFAPVGSLCSSSYLTSDEAKATLKSPLHSSGLRMKQATFLVGKRVWGTGLELVAWERLCSVSSIGCISCSKIRSYHWEGRHRHGCLAGMFHSRRTQGTLSVKAMLIVLLRR
jgi:hypothetical protein